MGAHTFMHTVVTTDELKTYDDLVQEAWDREGRNSYNGTISTTTKCLKHFHRMQTDAEVEEWLKTDEPFDLTQKWGPCKYVTYPESFRVTYFGWAAS